MLNLNIQFNGFNDLAGFIQALQVGSSTLSKQVKQEETAKPAEPKEAPTEKEALATPGKPEAPAPRRGRPPKNPPQAQEAPKVAEPAPATTEPSPTEVNEADVQKALEQVFNEKGMNTARDLLSRYGAKRLGELKHEKYGEFAEHAKRVLAGEPV